MKTTFTDIHETLQKLQSKKRFWHTLGVEYTASSLAMCHECEIEKARLAGALHDCAKYLSDKELLDQCLKHSIPVRQVEKQNGFLLHAKLGAFFAEYNYGVTDKDILNAITFHTTGRPDMTKLEKIIFIADYIEPSRKEIPDLDKIRKTAFIDLDNTMFLILKQTLDYLYSGSKKAIDEMTQRTYEFYSSIRKERGN